MKSKPIHDAIDYVRETFGVEDEEFYGAYDQVHDMIETGIREFGPDFTAWPEEAMKGMVVSITLQSLHTAATWQCELEAGLIDPTHNDNGTIH